MSYYDENDLKRLSDLGKYRPKLFEKFSAWYAACKEDGALTRREKTLIGLAVAHAVQCPYCIDAYSQACQDADISMDQMTEAVHMAAAVRGGATLIHSLQMQFAVSAEHLRNIKPADRR